MRVSELQNGVPRPKRFQQKNPLIIKNAERAAVDQSFVVTLEEGDNSTARGIGRTLGVHFKDSGKKFLCHKERSGTIRIWRIK